MKETITCPSPERPSRDVYLKERAQELNPNLELASYWKETNFSLEEELEKLSGPFIEVGGPTTRGFFLIDTEKFKDKFYISNIFPGVLKWQEEKGVTLEGGVNFQADATKLPIKNEGVGAIFCSCLGSVSLANLQEKDLVFRTPQEQRNIDVLKKMNLWQNRHNNTSKDTEKLREKAIKEAYRALIGGGLLVWEGGKPTDLATAEKVGFIKVEEAASKLKGSPFILYNWVFRKPAAPNQ